MGEGAPKIPGQIDFTKPPARVEDFKIGDKVTRENFLSFLITGFRISRGSFVVQRAFYKWIGVKNGVDYLADIKYFCENGAWHLLTPEEHDKFTKAHMSNPGHETKNPSPEFLDKNLRNLYNDMFQMWAIDGEEVEKTIDFKKIETITEFNLAAAPFLLGAQRDK